MSDSVHNPVWTSCKDAAGIAGNIFAFGLFVSPIPTYRRIIRNRSTEQFSGLPYIYALMNCLICMWYGMPLISADNLLVVTVNSFGTVFQLAYIILFIIYAERKIKVFIPFYLQNLSTFYGFYVLIHLHLLSLVAGRLVC
uniref:Bidirectional sugar transporter SWEET n=1 Tax=Populus trichocarpa TaxID=3694 RepID=A0A2K2CAD6_POPTR